MRPTEAAEPRGVGLGPLPCTPGACRGCSASHAMGARGVGPLGHRYLPTPGLGPRAGASGRGLGLGPRACHGAGDAKERAAQGGEASEHTGIRGAGVWWSRLSLLYADPGKSCRPGKGKIPIFMVTQKGGGAQTTRPRRAATQGDGKGRRAPALAGCRFVWIEGTEKYPFEKYPKQPNAHRKTAKFTRISRFSVQ